MNPQARMKRIFNDMQLFSQDPPPYITAGPTGNDLYKWAATIAGPQDSPYSGGLFELSIILPPNYPESPPLIKFNTKIYHPNINDEGSICLDILKSNWSPALSLGGVLVSILSLLTDPNPNDPLVPAIGDQYKNDKTQFWITAQQWTNMYAAE